MTDEKLLQIETSSLNISIIKEKKDTYGNNLPDLADMWSNHLSDDTNTIDISPRSAARMLAMLKIARLDFLSKQLESVTTGTKEYFNLRKQFDDTCLDYANYMWISKHYKEYVRL